ncbi:UvrD-helicase domain-containing protein [Derxia gummosa]|uniref:RecBCD enzyme subunit RecB n=1 Tax=Derxia gummosa DSM 723 TaxID=1121388 RepID=A0A8B6X4W7_9BURK|nr:UvrD-helicase domain-containing protein [Derxia gummosa]
MTPPDQLHAGTPAAIAPAIPAFDAPLTGLRYIEASAGTGKTWTLAGLVARLVIERGLEIGRILVVTFTKAATAELRARIRDRLDLLLRWVEWRLAAARDAHDPASSGDLAPGGSASLRQPDDDGFCARYTAALPDLALARRQLVAALRSYDEASVFTIHGFCQRALAERAFSGRQRFELELLDDIAGAVRETVADWWRRKVVAHDPTDAAWCPAPLHPWLAARVQAAWEAPAVLAERIGPLLNREGAACLGGEPPELGSALAGLARDWAALRADWQRDGAVLADAVRACKDLSGTAYRAAWIDGWQARIDAAVWSDALPDADALDAFTRFGAERLHSRMKKGATARFTQPLCARIDAFCAAAVEETGAGRKVVAWALRDAFASVCRELPGRLERAGGLGFSSLITRLRDALLDPARGEALGAALAERYPAALIDEFQDTDPTQNTIFRAIYGERGDSALALFVGDPKQAIYAFRGADLDAYYDAIGRAESAGSLVHNRRSTAPLLAAFNALFAREHPFRLPRLPYPPAEAGATVPPLLVDGVAPAPFRWLWLDAAADTKADRLGDAARAATAALAELLAAGATAKRAGSDSSTGARIQGRPLAPGDCAVLVRTNAEGELMRRSLLAAGIGCALSARRAVFETPEAHALLDLLRGAANPRDSVAARAALAGPWFGWSAAEVLEGRRALADEAASAPVPSGMAGVAAPGVSGAGAARPGTAASGTAPDAPQALAGPSSVLPRHADGFELLSAAREVWLAQGVFAMLRGLALAHDLAGRLGVLADGERRLANCAHLMELCDAAARDLPGPEALADWLAARIDAPGSAGETAQLRLESDENLVQIVTIHKSKGLEYPVVVLPFLWAARKPPKAEGGPKSAVAAAGPVFFHDPATRAPTLHFAADDAATLAAWDEEAEEALRLLYVAVTRARQACLAVAGPFDGLAQSALGWLLGLDGEAEPDAVRAALDAIRERAPEAIAVAPPPEPRNIGPLLAEGADDLALAAAAPPGWIAPAWRYTSFTGLLHGRGDAGDHAAERDEFAGSALREAGRAVDAPTGPDADAAADLAVAAEARRTADVLRAAEVQADADLRWHWPRGPEAGVELHAFLEPLDWTRPAARQPALPWPRGALTGTADSGGGMDLGGTAEAPPSVAPADAAPAAGPADRRAAFAGWIDAIGAAPLFAALAEPGTGASGASGVPRAVAASAGASLASLPRAHTAREVEFAIPLSPHALERGLDALRQHGVALPPVDTGRLGIAGGWLRGVIDFVFAHDGRWWLADYKSNWLGDRLSDYRPAALDAAMTAEGYRLQAWLYLLALHRWLGLRLRGYDPARHLGGALYLFLRGMTPALPGNGVCHVPVDVAALLAFDRALPWGDRPAQGRKEAA